MIETKMLIKLYYLIGIYLFINKSTHAQQYTLPTIFWDSTNPLFQCDVPTIRIRYEDRINIVCPKLPINQQLLSDSTRLNTSQPIVENMFFVDSKEKFEACDATGGIQLLRCNPSSVQTCDNGIKCSTYYSMLFTNAKSSTDIDFKKGQMHYFIGTGFRTPENVDNTRSGSCERTMNQNEGRLRLRVYICTDEEVNNGECEVPSSSPAFYQDCDEICGPWQQMNNNISFENLNKDCFKRERRVCSNMITLTKREEIRQTKVLCPAVVCSAWGNGTNSSQFYVDGNCYVEEQRNCVNSVSGFTQVEKRKVKVVCDKEVCTPWVRHVEKMYKQNEMCYLPEERQCYQPWIEIKTKECRDIPIACNNKTITDHPQTGKSTSTKDDEDYKIYIIAIVISTILSSMLGLLIGSTTQKCYETKKIKKQNEEVPAIQLVASQGLGDNGMIVGTLPRNSNMSVPMYVIDGVIDGVVSPTVVEEEIDDANTVSTDVEQSDTNTPKSSQTDDDEVFYPHASQLPRVIQKQQRRVVSRQPSATRVVLVRNVSDASAYQQRVTRLSLSDGLTLTRAVKSASNIEFVQHI